MLSSLLFSPRYPPFISINAVAHCIFFFNLSALWPQMCLVLGHLFFCYSKKKIHEKSESIFFLTCHESWAARESSNPKITKEKICIVSQVVIVAPFFADYGIGFDTFLPFSPKRNPLGGEFDRFGAFVVSKD